jgi:Helix-turn-helix domain
MICPVELASDMSALQTPRVGDHARHGKLLEGRDGAGYEGTGSDLRVVAKKITRWQAAEIIGISGRQMRRWRCRYEEFGFRGLFDRRRGKPSHHGGVRRS